MPEKNSQSTGHSRARAEAELRAAAARVRTRWTPPWSGGARSRLKHVISRALRPYDRHTCEMLSDAMGHVGTATRAVADDVDSLRDSVDALHGERAAFDTFVTPDMDKLALEMHAKRSRFASYLGDHLAVCRVLGNMKMFVDTRDHWLAANLMTDGYWESWITLAMLRLLEPGMVAVDVGANYGYYSVLMGRCVGHTGKVISFEPNPQLARLMRKSLFLSGIRRIDEVHEEAAYSTTGESVQFLIPPEERWMNARVVVDEQPGEGTVLDVPTVRLDDVLPEKVDFIKIDAEGGEREIWRGMSKTIENNPQLQIFLEFNPQRTSHYDPHEFLDKIQDDGFELAVVGYDASTRRVDGEKLIAHGTEQILHLRRAPRS